MIKNQGFRIGDHIIDGDGNDAKIARFDVCGGETTIVSDYSGFPGQAVPDENATWTTDEVEMADPEAEFDRQCRVGDDA